MANKGDRVKRSYDSRLRLERADATRLAIAAAAGRLFAERGYAATSIEEIAAAAGVGRATVFTSVGGKPELLKEAYRLAVRGPADGLGGGHGDDPVLERMGRVRRLGLDVEIAVEAELRGQPVRADEGERPTGSPPAGGGTGRKSAYRQSVGGPASTVSRLTGGPRRRSRPRAGRSTGRRRRAPRAGRRRNSLCRRVERPSWSISQVGGHIYRGGAPPDLAPFSADRSGCRGFTGPVPPPLWMRFTGDRPRQRFFPIVAGSV